MKESDPPPAAARGFWRRFAPAKLRLWAVLVPLHIGAFVVLYFGTLGFLEHAYADAGAEAARQRLDQAVREMPFFAPAVSSQRTNPHIFGHLLAAHAPIGLRLYGRDGAPVGSRNVSADPADARPVREFLAERDAASRVWLERSEGRELVRGLHRVVADPSCTPCHSTGETLGAASMRIDYTEPLHELRGDLRVRVGALLGTWVVLVGAVSVAVQRTAKRSARRLEAEIADAAVAAESSTPPLGLPLDPVTAEVHRTLRDVLRRQRAREQDVARQLAHADQLAGLGRLAASLAHEIKNPLAGIQGALELLCDETAEGDQKRLYGEMLNELGRVNGILHRLLESGRPAPLRVVRSDLGALIGDTIALLQPSLRRQRVELASEVAEGLSAVELDPAKIRQVLVNLIQNAAEAIGERGGSIRVRASVYRDAAAAVVTVEDDGPGIPADVLPRLFEPFYTTKFTGTGLGLAISKSLVEQHGGSLEAASEPGRGASFVLVLPLAREAALPAEGS